MTVSFLTRFVLLMAPSWSMITGCQNPTSTAPGISSAMMARADRPIALIEGSRIDFGDLRAGLLESTGAEVVREHGLDVAAAREAARRGIEIDEAAIARERTLLVQSLSTNEDRAEILLAGLRRSQGLGPVRFTALLRRNALLRALVSEDVVLEEEVVMGVWDRNHGAKRTARVIATRDLRTAEAARRRVLAGEDFAVVAVETSIDASAARGGRLAPVSRHDPSWPSGFRRKLFELQPGTISDSIPLEGRMLVIEVLEEQPADGVAFEDARPEAERVARLAAERLLMDRLARRLMPDSAIDALDPSLRWSLEKESGPQLRR